MFMRLSLENRFFVFCIFFLICMQAFFVAIVILYEYALNIFCVLLAGAVCGTVFWHRIPDQIQNLLVFNLVFWPIILVYGIFADVLEIDDEISGYVILSVQCVVLCFGIFKYIYKKEIQEKEYLKNETRNQSSQALSEDKKQAILFFMLGKMAKADGQVSKDEIDAVEAFMTRADFDQDTRKKAIVFFNAGKTTTRPFYEIATEFAQCDIDDLHAILEWLLELVFADGVLHAIEEQYLNDAATAFGLSPNILTQALKEKERLSEVRKYYAILGCDLYVSDDELKRRYRELSKQYHPDRIFSKDLPPYLHKFSKEKFQEIQNAYEVITEQRK
ncbi:MAG: DnaJ domain-containing protein [Gemmatimonadetes bacterium]|nr:DnaJ domain-containing protein [Gemmatimonadota bacterium]